MISYITGKILHTTQGVVEVLNNGIGYTVRVQSSLSTTIDTDANVELFIFHVIREDSSDLYGFSSRDERELFEKLISVSGIGPKSALNILDVAGADAVINAVRAGEAEILTKVSGVGKKTAERVVLELRNKLGIITATGVAPSQDDVQVIEALVNFGYSESQAREAMKSNSSGNSVEDKIKNALQYLSS